MWQPISTAPKDGSFIWLGKPNSLRVGFWGQGKEFEHKGSVGGGWRDMLEGRDLHFVPTHWQPTPKPPEPTLTRAEAIQAIRDGKIERYCVPGQWRTVMVHGVPIVEELG